MRKRFVAAREAQPGAAWRARFMAGRAEAEQWYLGRGLEPPPRATDCRATLLRHMPELIPHYDRARELVGDDDLAHRMLSHYRPPPIVHGCSQAVWLGAGGPALVRNYDFPLEVVSGRFESASWLGREVIMSAQRPWGGCLDGMNEDGLVASLTFGGNPSQGLGFSVILMLRYVLETCRRVDEAVAALCRIPIALSQNVMLLDRSGAYATVFLGPDRAPAVSRVRVCTNHQENGAGDSVLRHSALADALEVPRMTLEGLIGRFFKAPLYSRRAAFTTVYTAVYWPDAGRVDYRWPGKIWSHAMGGFAPGEYVHDYGALIG